jgi:hypothetical protein
LGRLSAGALGVKGLPDPTPEALSQWAMFEQLPNAMPLGMGA